MNFHRVVYAFTVVSSAASCEELSVGEADVAGGEALDTLDGVGLTDAEGVHPRGTRLATIATRTCHVRGVIGAPSRSAHSHLLPL
jgi:hypothetical protein